jgi:hypothetical protein
MAKLMPGVIPTKFQSGGNILDTVPIKSSAARTLTQCLDISTYAPAALGTRDFTVIMICPALTLFHGVGGANMIPTSSKLGGFIAAQTDNLQSTFNANMFWDALFGKTMLEIFGSDGAQLTNSAFVWATLFQFTLISQIIGATGVAHYGALPYSSLFSEDGGFGTFTVDDLVKMSGYTKSFSTTDKSFALQNSIVMDSIVSTPTDALNAQKSTFLCSEVVTYVVL